MPRALLVTLIVVAAAALSRAADAPPEGGPAMASCCPTSPPTLTITWERLVADGETCPRCGETGDDVDKAIEQLRAALTPLGIAVVAEKRELSLEEFQADPGRSNRILLNGRLLEDWLGGEAGQSPCCDVCGDAECRTVAVDGETYEAVPADLIVRAGLAAAAALKNVGAPAGGCCPTK